MNIRPGSEPRPRGAHRLSAAAPNERGTRRTWPQPASPLCPRSSRAVVNESRLRPPPLLHEPFESLVAPKSPNVFRGITDVRAILPNSYKSLHRLGAPLTFLTILRAISETVVCSHCASSWSTLQRSSSG